MIVTQMELEFVSWKEEEEEEDGMPFEPLIPLPNM
jgi:hypothetical protein